MTAADIVRRGFDAFVARDFDTVREIIDAAVVWRIPGASVLAGEHHGLGTYTTEPIELYAADGGAVVRYRADGPIVEVDAVPFDQRAFDDFWS